jgi:sporulation protein YlmC with PRC-barrel domain
MRIGLLAGATVLSLLASGLLPGGAWSATPEVDPDSAAAARSTLVDRGQIARHGLIGKVVVDRNGDAIGTVADVLMVSSGGAAETVVIQSGGGAGVGERLIAVPIAALRLTKDGKGLRIEDLTRQQAGELKAEPASSDPAELEPSMLIGHEVVDVNGKRIGTVDNLLMSGTGDRPTKAIIKSGGFLGLGSKLIVVDFASLRPSPNQTNNVLSPGVLVVSGLTREQVRQMESFRYDAGMHTYRPSGL